MQNGRKNEKKELSKKINKKENEMGEYMCMNRCLFYAVSLLRVKEKESNQQYRRRNYLILIYS